MKAFLNRKIIRVARLILAAGIAVAVLFAVRVLRAQYDHKMTVSCANHAIQLKFLVMSFVETNEAFPSQTDARTAFTMMDGSGQWPPNWLWAYGSEI